MAGLVEAVSALCSEGKPFLLTGVPLPEPFKPGEWRDTEHES